MEPVALVSGGGRGIGAAICRSLSDKGYRVFVNYNRSEKQAVELCRSLNRAGGKAIPLQGDLRVEAQASDLVDQVMDQAGGIDVLINNAGVAQQKLFTDITSEDWDFMFDSNVKGMFFLTKAVLPHMISEKRGRIVNISSMWGISGASCEVHYSASKAAVIGFTKALAKEVGPSGITVNCVAPGVIHTEMNGNLRPEDMEQLREETPLCRIGEPEEVAALVAFLVSEEARFITGQIISADGGFGV